MWTSFAVLLYISCRFATVLWPRRSRIFSLAAMMSAVSIGRRDWLSGVDLLLFQWKDQQTQAAIGNWLMADCCFYWCTYGRGFFIFYLRWLQSLWSCLLFACFRSSAHHMVWSVSSAADAPHTECYFRTLRPSSKCDRVLTENETKVTLLQLVETFKH